MTLIIARVSDDSILAVADEYVTRDHVPIGRCTKLRVIPHLGALILGTGSAALVNALSRFAHDQHDGSALNMAYRAPAVLRAEWQRLEEILGDLTGRFSSPGAGPCTVWLAAIDQHDGHTRLWSFTAPDFELELHHHGGADNDGDALRWVSARPPTWAPGEFPEHEKFDTLDDMVDLAIRIKRERDDVDARVAVDGPEYERDSCIGGALWVASMWMGAVGPVAQIGRVHEFDEDADRIGRYANPSSLASAAAAVPAPVCLAKS